MYRKLVVFSFLCFLSLLTPYLSQAGNLEPSAPPGPTMHSLEEIYNKPVYPISDKTFVDWPANPRFAVCDNGTGENLSDDIVLDKETGLIWARDAALPSYLSYQNPTPEGDGARDFAFNVTLGNRLGWRLPTFDELRSLIDPSKIDRANPPASAPPALPDGHPFINVKVGGLTSIYGVPAVTVAYMTIDPMHPAMNYYWICCALAQPGEVYAWPVRGPLRHQ